MRKNKKRFIFLMISVFFIGMPALASAGRSAAGQNMLDFLDASATNAGLNKINSGEDATMKIIGGIINTVLGLVGIIFFVLMLWAGIRWMTSQGNEEIIKEAKNTIRTAIIGIVVVFSSFLITNFILNQLKSVNSPAQTTATENSSAPPPPINSNLFNT